MPQHMNSIWYNGRDLWAHSSSLAGDHHLGLPLRLHKLLGSMRRRAVGRERPWALYELLHPRKPGRPSNLHSNLPSQ